MARPKAFERDAALQAAIDIFSQHGYEGSSTQALLKAMGISRQSLYDTFGDKRRLYLEALQRYASDSVSAQIGALNRAASPLLGIEAVLRLLTVKPTKGAASCLGVSAVCEFGRTDPEVAMLGDIAGRSLVSALERRLDEAKQAGELGAGVDVSMAAQFLLSSLAGIKVASRGGAPQAVLNGIVQMAMRSLK